MNLIKLDATTSTNTYLKQLCNDVTLEDFTVVWGGHQTQGRGQGGNIWQSKKGKNLTVSILKKNLNLEAIHAFALNSLVSLAIYEVLIDLYIPNIRVKWPNDIMAGNQKLCGILIENTLSSGAVRQSIIGFGLNVNQTRFEDLPRATSLWLKTGKEYDLDDLLMAIVDRMKHVFTRFEMGRDYKSAKVAYEAVMFRKNVESQFVPQGGKPFTGIIQGIDPYGRLKVLPEKGPLRYYATKEVSLVH